MRDNHQDAGELWNRVLLRTISQACIWIVVFGIAWLGFLSRPGPGHWWKRLLLINVVGLGIGILVVNIKRAAQAFLPRRKKRDMGEQADPGPHAGRLPSLEWFVGGIAMVTIYVALGSLAGSGLFEITGDSWITDFLLVPALIVAPILVLGAPFCFIIGANHAWREKEDQRAWAKLSRWLNVVALAMYLGVIAHLMVLVMSDRGHVH